MKCKTHIPGKFIPYDTREQQLEYLYSNIRISEINFYDVTPCWEWKHALDKDGYGRFYRKYLKKAFRSHREFYRILKEDIPEGLVIDHLCRNRCCCNPGHLEPVTLKENVLRGNGAVVGGARNAAKTNCKQGHEFTQENTYFKITKKGGPQRSCRACGKKSRLEYQRKKTKKYKRWLNEQEKDIVPC